MAINKCMFIALNRRSVADRKIVIRYSLVEIVDSVNEIKHPHTGVQRLATAVLKSQDSATREKKSVDHARVVDRLQNIKDIGHQIQNAFEAQDLDEFGRLMHKHWEFKRRMSASISLSLLDQLYEKVRKEFGVLGGKIIGAGGGGFLLMLYCPAKGRALDEFMAKHEMPRVSYFPTLLGSRVVSDMISFDDFDHS
jgi:D-glycero-alpha-D-manno-heptose-7-phosphate kinase